MRHIYVCKAPATAIMQTGQEGFRTHNGDLTDENNLPNTFCYIPFRERIPQGQCHSKRAASIPAISANGQRSRSGDSLCDLGDTKEILFLRVQVNGKGVIWRNSSRNAWTIKNQNYHVKTGRFQMISTPQNPSGEK